MFYFTVDDIRLCHDKILEQTLSNIERDKGQIEEIDRLANTPGEYQGKLDSIVYRLLYPQQKNFSNCSRIGKIVYDILTLHPFVEGNKRTAYFTCTMILSLNGLRVKISAREVNAFFLKVAKGDSSEQEVIRWVKKCSRIRFPEVLIILSIRVIYLAGRGIRDVPFNSFSNSKNTIISSVRHFVEHVACYHN